MWRVQVYSNDYGRWFTLCRFPIRVDAANRAEWLASRYPHIRYRIIRIYSCEYVSEPPESLAGPTIPDSQTPNLTESGTSGETDSTPT